MPFNLFCGGTIGTPGKRVQMLAEVNKTAQSLEIRVRLSAPWREVVSGQMHQAYFTVGILHTRAVRKFVLSTYEAQQLCTEAAKQDFDSAFAEFAEIEATGKGAVRWRGENVIAIQMSSEKRKAMLAKRKIG